ncbi:MAG: hypothetical protein OXU20_15600 [Myxococcales bacterium]|nr:hypothetical protein [Myxococcales bacterium]
MTTRGEWKDVRKPGRGALDPHGALAISCLLVACGGTVARPVAKPAPVQHVAPTCDPTLNRTHDLGTGSVKEIRRLAPEFFALRPEGWKEPTSHTEIRRAEATRPELNRLNKVRIDAVRRGTGSDFQLRTAMIDDIPVVEVRPRGTTDAISAWAWTLEGTGELAVLVEPQQCPHVVAKDACEEGRLVSHIAVDGTIPCLGSRSIDGNDLWLQVKSRYPVRMRIGEIAVSGEYSEGRTLVTLHEQRDTEAIAEARVLVNDYATSSAEAMLALASSVVEEGPLVQTYMATADHVPAGFEETLAEARAKSVAGAVQELQDDGDFLVYLQGIRIGNGIPGDEGVLAALRPRVSRILERMVERSPSDNSLVAGSAMISILSDHWSGLKPEIAAFEEHFGSHVASGNAGSSAVQHFREVFPESKYLVALQERRRKEAQQQAALRVLEEQSRAKQQKLDDLWYDLHRAADTIATLEHDRHWVLKYHGYDPRNRLAARRMLAHQQQLVDGQFCPARQSFLAVGGHQELKRRFSEHCEHDPPTGHNGGGGVALVDECRRVFAMHCR